MSESSNFIARSKNRRKILLGFFASVLLVTAIIAIVAGVSSSKKASPININVKLSAAHPVVKKSCSTTLYPELCVSAISGVPDAASRVKTLKDVIDLSLNLTITSVRHSYSKIKKISSSRRSFTAREKTALRDCLEVVEETLDELFKIVKELHQYPSLNKSISEHADDLKTLLSAALTNQETCLDGFSHDQSNKKVRELLIDDEMHVYHMCSNALAMIKNLTDTDMAEEKTPSRRKLKSVEGEAEESETEWPEWLSAGDRRLLQSTSVTPNVVVAADGSGNYRTVADAVAAAPEGSSSRYIIKIKAGVYRENVEVPSKKINIMFMGEGRTTTIITGSRNVVDGSTTFNSATVAAVGDGFLARDIAFQNTAGPSKHQAVALRVGSDQSAFYQCDMLAYQDTLYVHSLRQFFVSCYIAGTVDFIFGNAAAVLQNCDIHARKPNPGQRNMLTAQGRTDPNQNTGIVIQKCRIGATKDLLAEQSSFRTYLGRPWKMYSRTVVMQTDISDIIDPAGWYEWDGDFALSTLYYAEYQNTGAGANTANRVTWPGYRVITSASVAQTFTAGNFIAGASWLPATGFPYSLGL